MTNRSAFRWIFTAAAVSQVGTQISYIAIPLLAVVSLSASPGQIGLLGMLGTAAFLVLGLPAGAWVDRLQRRPVLIAADLIRAMLLASIPVAWLLGVLSLPQLYGVVLVTGICTVFFDVAAQSFLPDVAGRDHLTQANSALVSLQAVTQTSGRSVGAVLVQVLSAPVAMAVDALSYLCSAACILRIRHDEHRLPPAGKTSLRREIYDGARYVLTDPLMRPIALKGALYNLGIQAYITLLPLLFIRQLHLPPWQLGGFLALGGLGVLAGARAAAPLTRLLGEARTPWLAGAVLTPACLPLPLLDRGPMLLIAAGSWLVCSMKAGMDNVILVTFRQRITPAHLLGRMNATMRTLLTGALAVGSALSGLAAQTVGVRPVLWVAAAILSTAWIPLLLSPMRHLRDLPADPSQPLPDAAIG